MKYIPAKTILANTKNGNMWFGIAYNMNLYKGCPHGCIYCDSRSNCYNIDDFDTVRIKENALEILEKEIKSKRKRGVIGIGAMSDTYNPFEKKYEVTRSALEIVNDNCFGISIETKSDLITRDIDIFKKINLTSDVILKLTITSAFDEVSKIIEPNVCVSSKRFDAIKKLSDEGLFVGTLLTPLIPFITDSEENIKKVIELSAKNGAKFVYSIGGVTLRENQREYFYNMLDKSYPGLKSKYISLYGNKYYCKSQNKNLGLIFKEECKKYGLLYKMEDIIKAYKKEKVDNQISIFN